MANRRKTSSKRLWTANFPQLHVQLVSHLIVNADQAIRQHTGLFGRFQAKLGTVTITKKTQ